MPHPLFPVTLATACFTLTCVSFSTTKDGDFAPSLAEEHHEVINLLETERIQIFADKELHRDYAQRFSERVYDAAYETTGEPAGKGLVVIGNASDPHPILLVKQYLELAFGDDFSADDPEIKSAFGEIIKEFQKASEEVKKEVGVDLDSIAFVAPMPLEGPILNIYLMAKEEAFDPSRIEKRIRESPELEVVSSEFENFDWAVYLPPKNAIDKALKEVLPAVMKKQKMGFFKRTLVRGAVATFKPLIRDAMEGVRKGVMYNSILKATSDLNEGDRNALTEAYIGSLMPRGKIFPGKKEERSFEAIHEQKRKNAAYAKDPYIRPEATIALQSELYETILGSYLIHGDQSVKVYLEEEKLFWRKKQDDPIQLFAVRENLFTNEDRGMTFEFNLNEEGSPTKSGEVRGERWRNRFHSSEPEA